ncbi:MAG TPA: SMC-Scp complex subunit ScpB [Candidatus Acidoferrum sp.]|nr:SMC-Scp complex subunit ScpB [Candidatus Acidoferrum sp.]
MEKPKQQPVDLTLEAEQAQDIERKAHCIALMEAALFVAGRPLDVNELCQVIGSRSKKKAMKFANTLIQEYNARNTALEILALKDERFVLQVKAEFTHLIQKLVNRPLLSSGPLKTLSYIALRQPISQKRVIDVRGQHAYGHIKELKERRLIQAEKSGRSMALKTTSDFADYFGLPNDITEMKKNLKKIFGDALKDETEK